MVLEFLKSWKQAQSEIKPTLEPLKNCLHAHKVPSHIPRQADDIRQAACLMPYCCSAQSPTDNLPRFRSFSKPITSPQIPPQRVRTLSLRSAYKIRLRLLEEDATASLADGEKLVSVAYKFECFTPPKIIQVLFLNVKYQTQVLCQFFAVIGCFQ